MQTVTQSDPRKGKPAAIALLVMGYLLLFAAVAQMVIRLDEWPSASGVDFIQAAATVGLSLARVMGNFVFDTHVLLSLACRIFVLCGLSGIVAGLRLLAIG